MDRSQVVDYLSALDDDEWAQIVADARGTDTDTDAEVRAATESGDLAESFRLKAKQLAALLQNPGR